MVLRTTNPDMKSDFIARVDQENRALMNTCLWLAPGCKIRALVVDDHPVGRETLVRVLTAIGVELETARSSSEAVEKVRVRLPDIIFMDTRMMAMGGKECSLTLQKEFGRGRIKIVILTSELGSGREEYIKAGCHYLISKPFRIETIRECLSRLLGVKFEHKGEQADASTAEAS